VHSSNSYEIKAGALDTMKNDEVDGRQGDLGLEMGDIKSEGETMNEEEESLLVGVQDNFSDSKEGVEYLGSTQLPNIIITPSRRQKPCTLATPDPDIQLAEPTRVSSHVSLASGRGGGGVLSLCGPNPTKISLICVVILSIWMSWVFIIHLNKEMSDMAVELEESNNNIKISEESNLAFRISTEEKLRKLETQLDRFLKRKRGGKRGRSENVSSTPEASTVAPTEDDWLDW